MTETMRAQRFYADSKTIAVEDVPIPEPGQGEVLVEVAFCGICHSDLSLINGTFPSQLPVVTQGHEASGTIAKLGPGVTGWSVGDRVVLAAGKPCRDCVNCRHGDVSNCLRIRLMAFAYDGAWAPSTPSLRRSGSRRCPITCRWSRPRFWRTRCPHPTAPSCARPMSVSAESVGVWGVGGLGTHMVQLARLVGAAPIIARLVGVGMSADTPSIGPTSIFNLFKRQVLGHLGYQNADIGTLARLVSLGRLDLSRSISDIVSLEDVAVGIEKLERADGDPIRILVQP